MQGPLTNYFVTFDQRIQAAGFESLRKISPVPVDGPGAPDVGFSNPDAAGMPVLAIRLII